MMPLLFRRSGGGASSATEAGVAVATAALLSATPALGPLLPLPLLLLLLLPPLSWGLLPRLDMVGPRPRARCWGGPANCGGSTDEHRALLPTTQMAGGPCCSGQAHGQVSTWKDLHSALRVVQAATAAAAARPRGRGGAGSCAPLWAPPPRCAPLQPRSPPCPGPEPESRRRGWPEAGRGGSLQHLPLLPLPAAQIKKQQKATNHPRAKRGAAGGGRSVRRPDSAGGAHGWAQAGQGWDAGPGFGGQGSAALLARFGRLLLPPPPPLLPPVPPPLHPRSGSAASAAAAAARPPGQEL